MARVVKKKKALFAFIIISSSLVVSVVLAELIVRQFSAVYQRMHSDPHPFLRPHPTRGYALLPGYEGRSTWNVLFRVNSLGFRGPEINKKKPEGTFRILILGDSIVMGSGLPEKVLVNSVLQKRLAEEYPASDFQVINGGIAGYDVKKERMLLKEKGVQLDPDVAVMVLCLNDVPHTTPGDHVNPLRDIPVPGKEWLYENSALAYLARGLYNSIGLEKDTWLWEKLRAGNHPPTMQRIERGWKEFKRETEKSAHVCREHGISLVLVLVPHQKQFEDTRRRFLFQKRVKSIAAKMHIKCVDLAPAFAGQEKLPYIPFDPVHPGPAGHRIMAEKIQDTVEELLKTGERDLP